MFTAICYDECGTEVSIEVEDLSQIPEEWKYRYSQKHTDKKLEKVKRPSRTGNKEAQRKEEESQELSVEEKQ